MRKFNLAASYTLGMWALLTNVGWAESPPLATLSQAEYKAVRFTGNADEDTKLLNAMAHDGWEWVGNLQAGTIAYRREPIVAQRVQILGTWELVGPEGAEPEQVEFTRDNRIQIVKGSGLWLIEMYPERWASAAGAERRDEIPAAERVKALGYELREVDLFLLAEKSSRHYLNMTLEPDTLTLTSRASKDKPQTLKRAK